MLSVFSEFYKHLIYIPMVKYRNIVLIKNVNLHLRMRLEQK